MTPRSGDRPGLAPTVTAVVQIGLLALLNPGTAGWVAGIAHSLLGWILLSVALRRTRTTCGPADLVTLVRSTLTGLVTALVADGLTGPTLTPLLVSLAATALALDAVDGPVARRTGTASPLGARFDMEVDAYLILVLSVQVATALGPWVLVIGAMRYAFVAAARVAPRLRAPLPPSRARKIVAAVQGVVLTTAATGYLPPPMASAAVATALVALLWSFGRDVRRLTRGSTKRADTTDPLHETVPEAKSSATATEGLSSLERANRLPR